MIIETLGALALATEVPNNNLMKRTAGRKGNFFSKTATPCGGTSWDRPSTSSL